MSAERQLMSARLKQPIEALSMTNDKDGSETLAYEISVFVDTGGKDEARGSG
jgi:hypothetical protein